MTDYVIQKKTFHDRCAGTGKSGIYPQGHPELIEWIPCGCKDGYIYTEVDLLEAVQTIRPWIIEQDERDEEEVRRQESPAEIWHEKLKPYPDENGYDVIGRFCDKCHQLFQAEGMEYHFSSKCVEHKEQAKVTWKDRHKLAIEREIKQNVEQAKKIDARDLPFYDPEPNKPISLCPAHLTRQSVGYNGTKVSCSHCRVSRIASEESSISAFIDEHAGCVKDEPIAYSRSEWITRCSERNIGTVKCNRCADTASKHWNGFEKWADRHWNGECVKESETHSTAKAIKEQLKADGWNLNRHCVECHKDLGEVKEFEVGTKYYCGECADERAKTAYATRSYEIKESETAEGEKCECGHPVHASTCNVLITAGDLSYSCVCWGTNGEPAGKAATSAKDGRLLELIWRYRELRQVIKRLHEMAYAPDVRVTADEILYTIGAVSMRCVAKGVDNLEEWLDDTEQRLKSQNIKPKQDEGHAKPYLTPSSKV